MMERSKILISGMFDMDNYGDLLFPLVARRRLEAAGHVVEAVAPGNRPAAFPDAMAPIDLEAMMTRNDPIGGIIIGGGYIIHAHSLDFLDRYNSHDIGHWCGAGIWLGATLAASLRDVPVVWNAPGVPHPFSSRQSVLVEAAIRAASYVSVRDRGSRSLLRAADDVAVEVVPDPILDLPMVWSKSELAQDWNSFLARKGLVEDEPLLAFHVRNRSIAGIDRDALAHSLRGFCDAQGLTPMFVAVGESHDDPAVARDLAARLGGKHVLLDDPLGLREITAALANARLYVGASLHGYVAAIAYGVPGILVGRPKYHKFTGLLEQIGRLDDFASDWDEALGKAGKLNPVTRSAVPLTEASAALDRHWQHITQALASPDNKGSERRDFVLALMRTGVQTDGLGWAMAPALNRRMRDKDALAPSSSVVAAAQR